MCLGQQNLEIYLGNRWMAQIKTNTHTQITHFTNWQMSNLIKCRIYFDF